MEPEDFSDLALEDLLPGDGLGPEETVIADGQFIIDNNASNQDRAPDAFIPALQEAMENTKSGQPYLIECMVKEGYDFSRDELAGL